jgi:murein DD-endopeptidase MepM/ murein hydrolase activator NlpD
MKIKDLTFNIFNKNLNSKIFLQLDEKKDRQPLKLTKRTKGTIALLLVTSMILSVVYASDYLKTHENNVFATDSFTIVSGENELCQVRDPELLNSVLKKIDKDLENRLHHEIKIESKYSLKPSKAKDKEIATEDELYDLINTNLIYSIMAYEINVNGERIGIVNSEYEAKSIIEEVKHHFSKDYDSESLLEVTTVEDIEIKQVKATNAEIQEKEKLVDYIIKGTDEEKKYIVEKGDSYWSIAEYFEMELEELLVANSASEDDIIQIGDELNLIVPKPFINVQVKRKVVQEEKMPYDTEYVKVSYMYNDEEIVTKAGKYGVSEIEAIVTEQNGIQIAKEVLSEKVITEPVTRIVTTGTQDPPPKQGTGYFINPLPGSIITSRFGNRAGGFHRGQDMAKAAGSAIKAADGGTVLFAGWSGSYGYMVDIDHGGGFTTRYAHCSDIYVSAGEKVYQGKIIAAVGSTGVSSGPHLHFEVRKYGSLVNPASYIGVQYRE